VCTPDGHRLLIGNPVYLAHPDGLAVNPLHK
jgi:hypothetical protein